jgi:hypothetical protein
MRLLKIKGKPFDYAGDDVEFPMSDILDSNIIDDAIWAMRCLPEHAQLWRKFAIWCGNAELQERFEQQTAAYAAFWSAKYACGKIESASQMLTEKARQTEKLRQILTLGHWED